MVYLISGFRWSFYEIADVSVAVSLAMIAVFLVACLAIVWWFFKTGYKIKNDDGDVIPNAAKRRPVRPRGHAPGRACCGAVRPPCPKTPA